MRTKKNRKVLGGLLPSSSCQFRDRSDKFKIKFEVSKDNISCFMGAKSQTRKVFRKPSKSLNKPRKQTPKSSNSRPRSRPQKTLKFVGLREGSPDIIRESSNTILSKIQQNGINCVWVDNDGSHESREEGNDSGGDQSLWSAFDNSYSKSYASTNDLVAYKDNLEWMPEQKMPIYSNSFVIVPELIMRDWRTTIMIRNIPNKYTISELSAQIDKEHSNTYDFLYLPCDLKNQCNVGYGFINFVHTEHLLSFYRKFNRYTWKKYKSEKICALTYARLQGLNELIEHFQNSKVLNQKEKKYRPIIKYDKIHKIVMEQQGR